MTTMRWIGWLGTALVILTACTREPDPDLALACQMTKCTCLPESSGFLIKGDAVPVEWKSNGDAYCPEGYVLRRGENK